ncbi:hypothetical protein D3C74_319400 [compost metagenome]
MLRHAQLVQSLDAVGEIEQPHDDFFPMNGRQRRQSNINGFAVHQHLDPAVLGQPPFGNVQVAQYLQSGDDHALHRLRNGPLVAKLSVDPVADRKLRIHRVNMDIAGPEAYPLLNHLLHQPDDGRILAQNHRIQGIDLSDASSEILNHFVHGVLQAIEPGNSSLQLSP